MLGKEVRTQAVPESLCCYMHAPRRGERVSQKRQQAADEWLHAISSC